MDEPEHQTSADAEKTTSSSVQAGATEDEKTAEKLPSFASQPAETTQTTSGMESEGLAGAEKPVESVLTSTLSSSAEKPLDMSTKATGAAHVNETVKDSSSTKPRLKSGQGVEASAGASDGPKKVPPHGGAGGPGMSMTAQMMAMMSKGGMPDMSAMPGMPDMSAMMGKMGGMQEMMAMMAKGMPNMSAMMGKTGGKDMKGGGMEMMDMMDCIIQVSLLKPDSDVSDDDDDSITVELPCPHCSRFFASNVSLKTHILVVHDHEDTSLLNLRRLSIERGKRSSKDSPSKQKHSRDTDKSVAAAASTVTKSTEDSTPNMSSADDNLMASEQAAKGVKRAWEGRKDSEEVDTSGAAGEAESNPGELRPRLRSGAAPSGCVAGSPPEPRKRKALLQMQRSSSGDSPTKTSTTKKAKGGNEKSPDDKSSAKSEPESIELELASADKNTDENDREQSDSAKSNSKESSRQSNKHKKIKAAAKEPETVTVAKEKDVSSDTDGEVSVTKGNNQRSSRRSGGVDSGSAAASAAVSADDNSPSTNTRSLRSRKVH
ncbi:hypothetical protein BaRGS_00016422 [Batillaria attramentaria]|uniref:C2H2-type domain-containing protein n=1 Tax=Batillaria attramentaria TaxID=370345 RepID=A0ABD0KZQ0_9CAEN